jgi:hypothetical protein
VQGQPRDKKMRDLPKLFRRKKNIEATKTEQVQKLHIDGFELIHFSLDELPDSYMAISYCWGDSERKHSIYTTDGSTIQVTANLNKLLLHLAEKSIADYLWIDALCINQDSIPERNGQILLMREIYQHASSVHVWLGENIITTRGLWRDRAQSAVSALQTVISLTKYDAIGEISSAYHIASSYKIDVNSRLSLVELFSLPWFERVWPIQEVVVATRIDMYWGNQEIKWDLLVAAIRRLTEYSLEGILISEANSEYAVLPPGYINARSTIALRDKFQSGQRNFFLEILMDSMRFQASDPRDKIYALLGVNTDNTGHLIKADYSLPVISVYRNTTALLIDASLTLLPLSSAGIGCNRRQHALPSWIPDYSTDPELIPLSTICSSQALSACTGQTKHSGSICGTIIELRGRLIDKVDRITEPVSRFALGHDNARIPDWFRSCLDFVSRLSDYPTNEDRKDVLQSVMIPNPYVDVQMSEHLMPIEDWGLTLQLVMSPFSSSSTDGLRRLSESSIAPFTTWACQRRFFETSKGYFGLSSNGILEDDLVAIVPGSNTPLILRETLKTHRGLPVYNLVADAFIHGYMLGEGMSIGSETEIIDGAMSCSWAH